MEISRFQDMSPTLVDMSKFQAISPVLVRNDKNQEISPTSNFKSNIEFQISTQN